MVDFVGVGGRSGVGGVGGVGVSGVDGGGGSGGGETYNYLCCIGSMVEAGEVEVEVEEVLVEHTTCVGVGGWRP